MADGRWVVFAAPVEGRFELWRVEVDGGRVERLTRDRHYLARRTARRPAARRRSRRSRAHHRHRGRRRSSSATCRPAGWAGSDRVELRRVSDLMGDAWARRQARRAGRALARGRRTPRPGLVLPGAAEHEAQPGAGRARDPRRAGHALRLVADLGVAAARRQRDQRLRVQPARLAGLRPGIPDRQRGATGAMDRCATSWPASTR